MEQDAILHALMSTLEKLDQTEAEYDPENERTLSDILHDEFEGISRHLRISSISGKAVLYPTPFPINPTKEMFFASFDMETSRKLHDFTRRVSLGANGFCEIRISPAADAAWEDPENMSRLVALGRFLEIVLERKGMIANVSRLPLIDMASGLLNSSGIREFGGKLLMTEPPENYVSIFMNLKDMKMFIQKYSDRLVESYLVRVSHKIFSFLDTGIELGAHYGGDNFFVLILKERLTAFREFISDAEVEVHGAEAPLFIPFPARLGIYEGKSEDPIGAFMNNASVAFQATRRLGEDVVFFRPELLDYMR